jgi:ketosteroid isomerase-like protein
MSEQSPENIDLTRVAVAAFNRRDWDAFAELVAENVKVESRLVGMEGGYEGHPGLRRWWNDLFDMLPDYTITEQSLHDYGDVTVLHFSGSGHGGSSGTPVIDDAWQATRWREGRIVWWRNCATESEALESAGLLT